MNFYYPCNYGEHLVSSHLSKARSFSENNSKWTFNAKVRHRTGFVSMRPARLWTSKEDIEKDVGLFVWSSCVRDKNDPTVPYPHGKWFKTMLPNDSWNALRALLAERGAKSYTSKKFVDL